jgi:hypothetical protein
MRPLTRGAYRMLPACLSSFTGAIIPHLQGVRLRLATRRIDPMSRNQDQDPTPLNLLAGQKAFLEEA